METHVIMKEFADLEFKAHNLISSVFIRFLAEETGSNFSSGLTAKLQEILQDVEELKKSVGKKNKGINRRLDSHTEHLKLICPKVDVKFKPLSNSDAEA
jgi:predicted phage-related endonuclease